MVVLTFLLIQRISGVYQYKSLAGPASEIPSFTPPALETSGMHSRYHVLPLLTLEDSSQRWTHSFPVDYCDIFAVTVFAKDPKSFSVKFLSPNGAEVSANSVYDERIGYGLAGLYPCRTFLFNDPIPSVGEWSITVASDSPSYPVNASLIASFYPSDLILQAFVPAENLIVGRSISIIALLPTTVGLEKVSNSTRSIATLENAITIIYLPDGSEKELKMEEGPSYSNVKRSMDATDLYASFEATAAGIYKSLVRISGRLSDGTDFIRSLWYVFTVSHPSIEITGNVRGSLHTHDVSQRDIVDFNIDVHWDGSDLSYRTFAQVWGTGENKEEVPVAWISGLVDVQRRTDCLYNCHYIHMQLDSRWLELANAKHPLTLRSVTLEELKAFITLSKSDVLEVTADDKLKKWSPSLKAENIEIDWEMKEGYNPYRMKKVDNITEGGQILLLHGYCASSNGFLLDYFDDYLLFEDYGQNRLHDEYAKAVVNFLNERGATRFSVVGHSQGGAVALHLYAYYQTGLDAVVSVLCHPMPIKILVIIMSGIDISYTVQYTCCRIAIR